MLKEKAIPTQLIDPGQKPPVRIVPVKKLGRYSVLTLVLRMLGFGLAMFWQRSIRRASPAEIATQTREFLEDLGGMWIKAGQLISARTDILTPEMAYELSQLTYQAYGFSPQIAREVVEASLDGPLETVFAHWEENPVAAASISQVHKARLRSNGAWVAVKVQRPGIAAVFERDLKLITWILRRFKHMRATSFIDWDAMNRELIRIMQEEVDYRYESSNLRRLRKLLKKHKVYVPKPYRRFCQKKIIVMEYINGVLMTDFLTMKQKDPARLQQWCHENNIKPRRVGSRLLRSLYRQLFEDRIFHGDLHPGNIMLLRNSRFALIDLGTIGEEDERFLNTYMSIAQGFASGDYMKVVYGNLKMAEPLPPIDLTAYIQESIEAARAWGARLHLDGLSYFERSATGGASSEMGAIAAKYHIGTSWRVLRLARSMNTLDANVDALVGNTNPNKIVKKYFKEAQRRRIKDLRKNGARRLVGQVLDLQESATYVSDMLRRQSIIFQGVQSKVSYILGIIFNLLRLGIAIVGIVLLYDFLRKSHFNIIAAWDDADQVFSTLAEQIPPMAYAVSLAVLILVGVLFFVAGRVKKRLSAPTPRLPTGRLDN